MFPLIIPFVSSFCRKIVYNVTRQKAMPLTSSSVLRKLLNMPYAKNYGNIPLYCLKMKQQSDNLTNEMTVLSFPWCAVCVSVSFLIWIKVGGFFYAKKKSCQSQHVPWEKVRKIRRNGMAIWAKAKAKNILKMLDLAFWTVFFSIAFCQGYLAFRIKHTLPAFWLEYKEIVFMNQKLNIKLELASIVYF